MCQFRHGGKPKKNKFRQNQNPKQDRCLKCNAKQNETIYCIHVSITLWHRSSLTRSLALSIELYSKKDKPNAYDFFPTLDLLHIWMFLSSFHTQSTFALLFALWVWLPQSVSVPVCMRCILLTLQIHIFISNFVFSVTKQYHHFNRDRHWMECTPEDIAS